MLNEIETAMLVTHGISGGFHGRPMMLAKGGLNAQATRVSNGKSSERFLYFATTSDSPKALETRKNDDVTLTFQDRSRFVSLNGRAIVTRDPALVARLWSDVWKVWFPKGQTDPRLCIIRVTPYEAEYWDRNEIRDCATCSMRMTTFTRQGPATSHAYRQRRSCPVATAADPHHGDRRSQAVRSAPSLVA